MTITFDTHTATNHTSDAVVTREPIELTVGLFFQLSPENRLRDALHAAGFTSLRRRRDVAGSIVLDAPS